jgi:antitoxin VapB
MSSLNIKNEETHRLAYRLAKLTGETMTKAVTVALKERLEREKRHRNRSHVADALMKIGRRCAARPVLDARTAEQILGYDEYGLPH